MPDEVIISIPEPHERNEVPDLLREIARQIEIGAHQGYHPRWILTSADNPDSVKLPDYVWPDPHGNGWIDAWNGWYQTLDEALADAKAGVGTPWVLTRGQGLISLDDGYADMANRALTASLTDAERGAADTLAERITKPRPNAFYPLFATCKVCGENLQFDIDPDGTPGRNGDWGANGDYGCITGDDEGCDGHTPVNIKWRPEEITND